MNPDPRGNDMSDTRLLSDEELRAYAKDFEVSEQARSIAAELIAYRAAESDAPFAVGDKVAWRVEGRTDAWTVRDTGLVHVTHDGDGDHRFVFPADLTPVPAQPTAAEVFAEAWRTARTGDTVGSRSDAAFREFCAAAGIDPDAPLPASEEAS